MVVRGENLHPLVNKIMETLDHTERNVNLLVCEPEPIFSLVVALKDLFLLLPDGVSTRESFCNQRERHFSPKLEQEEEIFDATNYTQES